MRKASHILGLIGGVLALVCAAGSIVGGSLITAIAPGFFHFFTGMPGHPGGPLSGLFGLFWQAGGVALILSGVMMVAVGVLALVGAGQINKNNTKAGVLMIVAGGLSMLTGYGWLITMLCVLGGIFALVKDKTTDNPPQ